MEKPSVSRKRKVMTLQEKIAILDKLKSGSSIALLSRQLGVSESTIRTIRNGEGRIRESVKNSSTSSAKVAQVPRRNPAIEKMEHLLTIWITDRMYNRIVHFNGKHIRQKAVELYKHIAREERVEVEDFRASPGWLQNFIKRNNVVLTGDAFNKKAIDEFKLKFRCAVGEKGYAPEQIFNAQELSLPYKCVGNFGAEKRDYWERLTLLFCTNASGTFKCKPLLVHSSRQPHDVLSNCPVHWKANKKAWVTRSIFEDWLNNTFAPEVELFLFHCNLPFRVLLLLDNSPAHTLQSLDVVKTNIEVLFFPPQTASCLQPMSLGILRTFQLNYVSNIYKTSILFKEIDDLKAFWTNYDAIKCVAIIKEAWDSVRGEIINYCWSELWPEICQVPQHNNEVSIEVMEMAKLLSGLDHHLEDLLGPKYQEPSNEELQELVTSSESEDDEDEHTDSDIADTVFIKPDIEKKPLMEFLRLGKYLANKCAKIDPNGQRSARFKEDLQQIIAPYHEMLEEFPGRFVKIKEEESIEATQFEITDEPHVA